MSKLELLSAKDKNYLYFSIIFFSVLSVLYISNEYIYSKKTYTYTNNEYYVFSNLQNNSIIQLNSSKYPAIANLYFSNFQSFDNSKLYNISNYEYENQSTYQSIENIIFTQDYQHKLGIYNFTPGTSLQNPFIVHSGTYNVNVSTHYNHLNAMRLENPTNTDARLRVEFSSSNNFTCSFWIYGVSSSSDIFVKMMFCSAWYTNYDYIHFNKTGISIQSQGDIWSYFPEYSCNNQWLWVTFESNSTHRNLYINQTLIFSRSSNANMQLLYLFGDDKKAHTYIIDAFALSNNFVKFTNVETILYEYIVNEIFEVNMSNSINFIYNYSLSIQNAKIFNKITNAFEDFNNTYSLLNYVHNNKILFNISQTGNEYFEIQFAIALSIYYFEENFYDLFEELSLSEIDFRINNTKIEENYSIILNKKVDLLINLDRYAIYNLIVIISYNITEVVSNE